MNFTLTDKNNTVLFNGSKQECMHFIKRRALNRTEITLQLSEDYKPSVHYTVPIESMEPTNSKGARTKPFYKRIFGK